MLRLRDCVPTDETTFTLRRCLFCFINVPLPSLLSLMSLSMLGLLGSLMNVTIGLMPLRLALYLSYSTYFTASWPQLSLFSFKTIFTFKEVISWTKFYALLRRASRATETFGTPSMGTNPLLTIRLTLNLSVSLM